MPSQHEIRQQITAQIIEALERGAAPWRRPWSVDKNAGFPANAVSRRRYSGINPLLIQIAAEQHGFTSRWWATYRQWAEYGGQVMRRPDHVPPGKWGTSIVFCKPCKKTTTDDKVEEAEEKFFLLKTYTVFCADQVLGAEVDRFRVGSEPIASAEIDERFERAEQVVQATSADIRHGGERAYYDPSGDYIQMPLRQKFAVPDYYDTLFHELTHWTEHSSRLNWDRSQVENTYALGELIAELGACFIGGELGLPVDESLGNHAAYLKSWLAAMQGDTKFIFKASSQASKTADYVLSFSRREEPELVAEPAIIL